MSVTHLDTEALDVVQAVDETLHITSMSELSGSDVLFKECLIGVVVRGVTIDESIQEECIEREAPVLWRRGSPMSPSNRAAAPPFD